MLEMLVLVLELLLAMLLDWLLHHRRRKTVELRSPVSAEHSSKAWNLRCHVREQLIRFSQQRFPECLPKTRLEGQPAIGSTVGGASRCRKILLRSFLLRDSILKGTPSTLWAFLLSVLKLC